MVGVWIDPVTAQVMMTLRELAMTTPIVRSLSLLPPCGRAEPSVGDRARLGDQPPSPWTPRLGASFRSYRSRPAPRGPRRAAAHPSTRMIDDSAAHSL